MRLLALLVLVLALFLAGSAAVLSGGMFDCPLCLSPTHLTVFGLCAVVVAAGVALWLASLGRVSPGVAPVNAQGPPFPIFRPPRAL